MTSSRLSSVKKNLVASYASWVMTAIMAFLCRTIFIRTLDASFLGINGLFSSILGVLSIAELGFGTAMNFEMYKPVANADHGKVHSLLKLYRKVYHGIGLFIFLAGLALMPFLPLLIKGRGEIGNFYLYYLLYLLNTVFNYYASFLFCLSNAEQKQYIASLFRMCLMIIVNVSQIVVLLAFQSFILYLSIWTVCICVQQVVIKQYFGFRYKQIFRADETGIDKETLHHIKKNMGGLIVNKLSEVTTLQTDNIIIALGLSIITVGFVDNYNLIITYLKQILLAMFSSVVPSMGNMVATEDREKCYRVFRVYDLAGFLVYGFCFVCLIMLIQPFVQLWAGEDKTIDRWSMILMCVSFYIVGRNHPFLNYKTAFGMFYDIKLTSIMRMLINLGLSIIGVYFFGLVGVYIGTVTSGLYENLRTLRLSYRVLTGRSVWSYLMKRAKQVFSLLVPIVVLLLLSSQMKPANDWIRFMCFTVITLIGTGTWMLLLYKREEEFAALRGIIEGSFRGLTKKNGIR